MHLKFQASATPASKEPQKKLQQKTRLSLFGDEDDDDGGVDLFAVSSKSTANTAKPAADETSKVLCAACVVIVVVYVKELLE